MPRHRLYFVVLICTVIGGAIGYFAPEWGVALKPLGDAFIALIRMLIGPVIFCTVVLGISGASGLKKLGRVGLKSILYFEVVSTFALVIGLVVVNVVKPGEGFHASAATLDPTAVEHYTEVAKTQTFVDFFLHLIPKTFTDAFTGQGDLIQILLVAVLFGWALNKMGKAGEPLHQMIEMLSQVFFKMVGYIMYLAPIGAAGAMAFTIGKYGVKSLGPLATLMACFYLTCALFVIVVLGTIAKICGFNILNF